MNTLPEGWFAGIPLVTEGSYGTFWCRVKGGYNLLEYRNRFIGQCSDDCDPPKGADIVPDSEDEYYWTGWFEAACDQCDTFWAFDAENVIAWMPLPKPFTPKLNP